MIPGFKKNIPVFEHDRLIIGRTYHGMEFKKHHRDSLEKYLGAKGTPYFSLIHNGVRFSEYVGTIHVGDLTINVLPKADRSENTLLWQKRLLDMIHKVGLFKVESTSKAHLNIKPNHILDLYFAEFIQEVESLVHKGLVKKYRQTENNLNSLKGSLHFSMHITKNFVHQEKFYTRHNIYDRENPFNKVVYKTIVLIQRLNTNTDLTSRIGALLLDFPVMPDFTPNNFWFSNVQYTRRTEPYRKAIDIARLLLLNYHPDLINGRDHVLALMFDMNLLWEKFVYVSLKNHLKDANVTYQSSKPFWQLENHRPINLKPDIIISNNGNNYVIDTKWKLIDRLRPSDADLKQMYAYTKYFQSIHTILCYPGSGSKLIGHFLEEIENTGSAAIEDKNTTENSRNRCSILTIGLDSSQPIHLWQEQIKKQVTSLLENFPISSIDRIESRDLNPAYFQI